MADLAVSVAPATAPAERAATIALWTISGVMATAAIVPQRWRGNRRFTGGRPQWPHLKQKGKTTDSFSGELAGDFMFWPTGRHRFGCYLEPAYDYSFAGGHQQSIGMSAGLLIGVR
jgi:hypothetical protein